MKGNQIVLIEKREQEFSPIEESIRIPSLSPSFFLSRLLSHKNIFLQFPHSTGPRVHVNQLTSPIDANFVYGSDEKLARKLRSFVGGTFFILSFRLPFPFLSDFFKFSPSLFFYSKITDCNYLHYQVN